MRLEVESILYSASPPIESGGEGSDDVFIRNS